MKRATRRVRRPLTPAERGRVDATRHWAEANQGSLRQLAKLYRDTPLGAASSLKDALALLKAERLRQELSLADMQERTGMGRPNLCRLENDAEANPTVATLSLLAEALGKQLVVTLIDK